MQVVHFFEDGSRKVFATYNRLTDSGMENDPLVDVSMATFRIE